MLLKATDLHVLRECSVSPYYFSMMQEDAKATDCLIRAGVDFNAAYECIDDDEYQPKVILLSTVYWKQPYCGISATGLLGKTLIAKSTVLFCFSSSLVYSGSLEPSL